MEERGNEELELSERGTGNKGYDDDDDENAHLIEPENVEYTPETSTGRETLRPKKFEGEKSKWGSLETPKLKKYIDNSFKVVEENFPNLNRSKIEEIIVNINESDEIIIKLVRSNAVDYTLFDEDGNMNEKIPKALKDILGKQITIKGLLEQLEIEKGKKNN